MKRESIIKNYFKAWEQKDWDAVQGFLSEDFRFTSAEGEDSQPVEVFKKLYWPAFENVERFTIKNIADHNDISFVKYECTGPEGNNFQNVELFVFKEEKIKSIEAFMGKRRTPGNGTRH